MKPKCEICKKKHNYRHFTALYWDVNYVCFKCYKEYEKRLGYDFTF